MLLVLVLLPIAPAAAVALGGWRHATGWTTVGCFAAVTAFGGILAARVVHNGTVTFGDGFLRADALSAFMIILIGAVATLAAIAAIPYIDTELAHHHTTRAGAYLYGLLVPVFVTTMILAVTAANIAVMWAAIEGTTVATVFLVGHRRTRASLEAAWKYVIIGSVGVVLAFLGTIIISYAGHHANISDPLQWQMLKDGASRLDPGVVRLGIGLAVLGYGTKVGLAPMHTWLPDAHSQAPAPVSALMSGVLLAVAFQAILRMKAIADPALGTHFMRGLLLTGALLSLLVAAALSLAQRDYKRLLAYSSIEHMGLVALAAAIGTPLAVAALLLHVLAHALGKTVLFLASGEILLAEGTTDIAGVRGLLMSRPLLGGTFALGLVALGGFPPFALFASELAIARAGFAADMGWVTITAFTLVFVVLAAVFNHGRAMLLGVAELPAERRPSRPLAAVPLIAGLFGLAAIGITIYPIRGLLEAAAHVVST